MSNFDLIFETINFTLERHPNPFVSRADGGHLRIFPKDQSITDRTKLTPKQAIEFMWLSMIAGESLEVVMNEVGIPVVKINYQDLGNWAFKRGEKPVLHLHIFGRAENAKAQVFPEAVYLPDRSTGFYDGFEPLTVYDTKLIHANIIKMLQTEKYQLSTWGI